MAQHGSAEPLAPGIRRAEPEDAELIADWLNRPAIRRYLASNLRGGDMTAALVRAALRRPDQLWALFCDDRDAPLGLIALDSIDAVDGVANLWYALGDESRAGQGLTSQALDRFLGANPLDLATVTAWVGAPNTASLRCLAKAGFHEIGRVSNAFVVDGARHDRVLFERRLAAT
ncbi:MAG: GNAT family protein [Alphaproteobacteria bacterium]|nr:GNAT family protein [Alphaproteobacteria bacterium]